MHALAELVRSKENWLIEHVLASASRLGYTRYTSTLMGAWQASIQGLSEALIHSLSSAAPIIDFPPEYDPLQDPVAYFGILEAQRHRARGVTIEQYLCLMKYYRQAYYDLLVGREVTAALARHGRVVIERFFDRLEIGISSEWSRVSHDRYVDDMRSVNRKMTIEKNRLMAAPVPKKSVQPSADVTSQKFSELMLLYQVSNTMLTTIRLNKLIHLVLTALTAGDHPFFDRAILFLTNERSGFMQGMLGVTRETSVPLNGLISDPADILGSSWDISEEVMLRQQDSEFSQLVRGSRLELDKKQNVSSRAVLEKRLIYVRDVLKEKRVDRELMEKLGISSFAVAPLIAKEKVFGIVLVDNALSGRRITQSELRLLQIFTNQAGVAIENALLYTRLEEANRNLREAQERLIHGERLATIGEMAASLAHELKGPLVSIGGFAKRLIKWLPATGEQHDSADMIAKEAIRLEKLLGDILSFGRKTTICYDHWLVQDMVEESLAVVAPGCAEQQIEIVRKYAKKPIPIIADGQQLKQVFLNLFFNAQEVMTGKQQASLSVSIIPSRLRGCPAVTIKVADTGGGVPDRQLHNIFAAFYTTKESGTGLGLPIAHRIVTSHRGTIVAQNVAGKGLEFTIMLPLQP